MAQEASTNETQGAQVEEKTLDQLAEFSDILKQKIKPRNETARREVDSAVGALVREAMRNQSVVAEDAIDTINELISQLDQKLTAQVNEIIHHEEFQKLEGAWRGLAYTVNHTETDASLQIKVLNTSKDELRSMADRYPGAKWDKSPLYDRIYQDNFDTFGGKPFGCVIGDFYFDHSPGDVDLLKSISKVCEASLSPFISAAAPTLFGFDSWKEINTPPDLSEVFLTPDYAEWNSMRESENSRFVALTMPRALARRPYGQNGAAVEEFSFEEDTVEAPGEVEKFSWMNAAYPMAVNINRAFKTNGICTNIRGPQAGGRVEDLPIHTFDNGSGGLDMKCPTEVSIPGRREGELSKAGLIGLLHEKDTDRAAFFGAQTLYKPKKMADAEDERSQNLSSRLSYIFAVSRFSHFLKKMMHNEIGKSTTEKALQGKLHSWIKGYVTQQPDSADEYEKARKPLADAKVEVWEDDLDPGYYQAKFYLQPIFQMEGVSVGMSLVSRVKND